MSAIGLTEGAFYSHFASKDELFAELIEQEVGHNAAMLAGTEGSPLDHVARCLRGYLSTHAKHPESGCALRWHGTPLRARAGFRSSHRPYRAP